MPYGPPRGCVFLARKAEPASGLISQEPAPVTSVPGVIHEPARHLDDEERRELRSRGAFAFVKCAHEAPILRGPGRLDSLSANRATARNHFLKRHPLRTYPRARVNSQLERILEPRRRPRQNFTVKLMKEATRMGEIKRLLRVRL